MFLRKIILLTLLTFATLSPAFAQSSNNAIRIASVQFAKSRSPYGGDDWLAATVRVQVQSNPDRNADNRNFVDNVKVNFALAINAGNKSSHTLTYFWSEVETATLERGTWNFRFYLPPAIIKHYRIGTPNPYAWVAEITTTPPSNKNTSNLPPAPSPPLTVTAVSQNLRNPERLARFQEFLTDSKSQQAGILLPQKETPFRDEDPEHSPVLIIK